jgi:hypothetical protein
MISLTKNPGKVSNISWLSRPVNASAAAVNSGIDRQDLVAFWLAYSFAFDDTEPLPSMFRRKAAAPNAAARPASADHSADIAAPPAGLSIFRISNMAASYIMAGVLFFFATVDASLLMMARFPAAETAVTWSAPEESVTGAATDSSTIETAEASEGPAAGQAGNSQLPRPQWEAAMNASTEKPVEPAGVCALPQFNCWKTATFIR